MTDRDGLKYMKESFPTIQEKKKNNFERFLNILKKGVVVGMIGLATSQSAESRLGTYIGHYHGKETHIEALSKEKARPVITLENIRRMVIQDESERMFIGTDEALYEVGGGEKESGFIKFEDIQSVIDEGEQSPIVGHTHPISVYDNVGYTRSELDEMKRENILPTPMPPSLTDIMGSVDAAKHFDEQNVEIRERVYDPTGIWEYRVQTDNEAVGLLTEFQRNLSDNIEANLTDSDRQIMRKFGLESIHPSKRIAILKSSPETSAIGNKLEQVADSYIENLPEETKEKLQKFGEIEVLCADIAGVKRSGQNRQQIKNLIDNYVQIAKNIGVQVSYSVNQ